MLIKYFNLVLKLLIVILQVLISLYSIVKLWYKVLSFLHKSFGFVLHSQKPFFWWQPDIFTLFRLNGGVFICHNFVWWCCLAIKPWAWRLMWELLICIVWVYIEITSTLLLSCNSIWTWTVCILILLLRTWFRLYVWWAGNWLIILLR